MDNRICNILASLCLLMAAETYAQVTLSAQIRIRPEYRDGQGFPLQRKAAPSFFISQRTRLNFEYSGYRFRTYASVQDVRLWGQDASSINRVTVDKNDGMMLHEAWGEISLVDTTSAIKNLTLKMGRQELVYDDARLLGNLDWLQQARRHDAALLKFDNEPWTIHFGAAYNQNTERKSGTFYNGIPVSYAVSTNGLDVMYKSMQFLYIKRALPIGNVSLLFFKDDFNKYTFAPADSSRKMPIARNGVFSRYTAGGNLFGVPFGKILVSASAFFQGGRYAEGTPLDEYFISVTMTCPMTKKLDLAPGIDITSGNNGSDESKRFQRFDPLYGTAHKFWGYMDYFYAADGFGPNGLVDTYLKIKYSWKEDLALGLHVHNFSLPNAIREKSGDKISKRLGTEIDFVLHYLVARNISIEFGCSSMFSTATLFSPQVKNIPDADASSSWAYVMFLIKPEYIANAVRPDLAQKK